MSILSYFMFPRMSKSTSSTFDEIEAGDVLYSKKGDNYITVLAKTLYGVIGLRGPGKEITQTGEESSDGYVYNDSDSERTTKR